ncbi:MAG: SDR family oxidoreductase, partial [Chloroflexi bacterium]|nr:SDR family oxidoreductase [Chloroflexota bacterium]
SGRGIGQGIARSLAREGAAVVVNDFGGALDGTGAAQGPADDTVKLIKDEGGRAAPNYGDCTRFESGRSMVQTALDSFGPPDIIVHVAGILRDRMVFNMTEEEWDAVVAVQLKGGFNLARHAVPHMIAKRWGRVLMISSGSGLGNSGQANYGAAHWAKVGMLAALARELGPYGITCNALLPGGRTRMTSLLGVPAGTAATRSGRGIINGGAVGALGVGAGVPQPEEAGDAANNGNKVAFLCTDEASHISGMAIGISGWQFSIESPRRVVRSITKHGRWTVDELVQLMPYSVAGGLVNPAPVAEAG